ncbi:hypothetical protein V8E36_009460 [Tilletia maclaganii]
MNFPSSFPLPPPFASCTLVHAWTFHDLAIPSPDPPPSSRDTSLRIGRPCYLVRIHSGGLTLLTFVLGSPLGRGLGLDRPDGGTCRRPLMLSWRKVRRTTSTRADGRHTSRHFPASPRCSVSPSREPRTAKLAALDMAELFEGGPGQHPPARDAIAPIQQSVHLRYTTRASTTTNGITRSSPLTSRRVLFDRARLHCSARKTLSSASRYPTY